jgi:hypothetical protein
MSVAYSLYGKKVKCKQVGYKRHHLRDLGMDDRKILMNLTDIGWEVRLAQDRVKWPTVLNVVVNLQVPMNDGNFLTSRVWFFRLAAKKGHAGWS